MDFHHLSYISCRQAMSSPTRLLFILSLLMYTNHGAEPLCNGDLVDALQFVCEDHGFYISRNTFIQSDLQMRRTKEASQANDRATLFKSNRSRSRHALREIVKECCFGSCSLHLLEQFCIRPVKPKRDVSSTSLQVFPESQALHNDILRRPLGVKLSKYEVWQRNAALRLRRGVPSILLTRKSGREVAKVRERERIDLHQPLITLPDTHPSIHPDQRFPKVASSVATNKRLYPGVGQ